VELVGHRDGEQARELEPMDVADVGRETGVESWTDGPENREVSAWVGLERRGKSELTRLIVLGRERCR
jgi:hypothetical protein